MLLNDLIEIEKRKEEKEEQKKNMNHKEKDLFGDDLELDEINLLTKISYSSWTRFINYSFF